MCQTIQFLLLRAAVWVLFSLLPILLTGSAGSRGRSPQSEKNVQAFRAVASVLTSPRCLNCHTSEDGPLQGDDNHPHSMNVKRGIDGTGIAALHCRACDQTENSSILHGPPGAGDLAGQPTLTPEEKAELSRRMAIFLPENKVPQFVVCSAVAKGTD